MSQEFDYDVLDVNLKLLVEHAQAARDAFIMRDFERGFEELIGAQCAVTAAKAQIQKHRSGALPHQR